MNDVIPFKRLAVHSKWKWSVDSRRNMAGCHPVLIQLADAVLKLSPLDLSVREGGGLRTPAQVASFVKSGTGIQNSLHLPQYDGYSHAIDLVVFIKKPQWNKVYYEAVRPAVLQASAELGILIQHGADWDIDGKVGEPGEWDWPHWQFPKLPARKAAAKVQMDRIRKELGLPEVQGFAA